MTSHPRVVPFLSFVLVIASGVVAQKAPGYDGTFPSAAGKAALATLRSEPWMDKDKRVDGGSWRIDDGGVTPFTPGPCAASGYELRTAVGHGPHLRLTNGTLAISVPAATDGDVAATLRWLGKEVPAGVAGEPSAVWRTAMARVDALGPASNGLRAGLRVGDKPGQFELLLWNVGEEKCDVRGTASLRVDGSAVALPVQWPPKAKAGDGNFVLQLAVGSTFVVPVDVAAVVRGGGLAALAKGEHVLEFAVVFATADGKPLDLRSKAVKFVVGEVAASEGKSGAGK